MKKRIIITALMGIISGIKADFFAYQAWVQPNTGQTIHEFYDIHFGKDQEKTDKQQQALVQFIKQHNGFAIIEDRASMLNNRLGAHDTKADYEDKTPLIFLETACKDHGVRYSNVEDNENRVNLTNIQQESNILDQNIIDTLEAHQNEHTIIIAAGADHCIEGVNKYLQDHGYQPEMVIVGKDAQQIMRQDQTLNQAFKRFMQVGSSQHWQESPNQGRRLINLFTNHTIDIEQDLSAANQSKLPVPALVIAILTVTKILHIW